MKIPVFSVLIVAVACALFTHGTSAEEKLICPPVPATEWRGELTATDIRDEVEKQFDGNWSAYIAHWERQSDISKDVLERKKPTSVTFGKPIDPKSSKNLQSFIDGIGQRIKSAYCLAKIHQIKKSTVEIADLNPEALARHIKSGKQIAETVGCPSCHGERGISAKEDIPNIAGQKPGYLLNQLRALGEKKVANIYPFGKTLRDHNAMRQWARELTPENKLSLAVYYSVQNCRAGEDIKKTDPPRPRVVDICLTCHGGGNALSSFVIPRLAGQKQSYLQNELRAFRMTKGSSKAFSFGNPRYHQYMSAIAEPLTNEEIAALANWFSAQRCEAGSK